MARLFKKEEADFNVSVSTHTMVKFIGLIVGAILLINSITMAAQPLTLIAVAFFLSLALNLPVRTLAAHLPGKSRGNRSMATSISVAVIMVALIGLITMVLPPLVKQTTNFVQSVPQLIDDVRKGEGPIGDFVFRYHLESQVDRLSDQFSGRIDNVGSSAFNTVSTVGNSIFSTLTVIVLTVMMLIEGPRWRKVLEELTPHHNREHALDVAGQMNRVIQGYVNGQVVLALVAALLMLPVLLIVGVPYPLALIVIVFICGLIPMVGHTIGAVIVTTVALFHSLSAALFILAYYIVYQQIENYFVQPKVQANSTNMSPLLVFVAVLIGASIGGLLGALVAIPVAGCLRILILDYLQRRDILTKKEVIEAISSPEVSKK